MLPAMPIVQVSFKNMLKNVLQIIIFGGLFNFSGPLDIRYMAAVIHFKGDSLKKTDYVEETFCKV